MRISVYGWGFTGATGLELGDGILVLDFKVLSDGEIAAKIIILPDASIGDRDVTIIMPMSKSTDVAGFQVNKEARASQAWICGIMAAAGVLALATLKSISFMASG